MLRNEIGWFDLDENSTGALSSKLASDATTVRSALADRLSTLVQNAALTITAFIIAFILSWRMAAIVIATYPLLIAASIAEQFFLKGLGGDYARSYARANSLAREAIGNVRTVIAFGMEDRISAQYSSELNQPGKQACARGHVSGLIYGLSQFLAFSSYALALWYASRLVYHHMSGFGDVMKSFMILIITSMSIAETLALAPHIVRGSQALSSVFSVLDRRTEIDPDNPRGLTAEGIQGRIEFREVEFRCHAASEVLIPLRARTPPPPPPPPPRSTPLPPLHPPPSSARCCTQADELLPGREMPSKLLCFQVHSQWWIGEGKGR